MSRQRKPQASPSRRGPGLWRTIVLALLAFAVIGTAAGFFLRGTPPRAEAKPLSEWRPADYHSLAFSPTDPNTLYFGHHNGLLKSEDGGRTWSQVKSERAWDAMSLSIPAGDGKTLYVAGHDVFYRSTDGGATWEKVRHNLPGTDIHGFGVVPENPQALYAFVVGFGLFQSEDGGSTWRARGALAPNTMALVVPLGGQNQVLAGSMGSGLVRTENGGGNWTPAAGGFSGRTVMALAASSTTPGLVYAGSERGLFKSTDAGVTWQQLPQSVPLAILAVNPQDDRRLAAIDPQGVVLRSDDGGQTWTKAG